jgi:hypothetical protein
VFWDSGRGKIKVALLGLLCQHLCKWEAFILKEDIGGKGEKDCEFCLWKSKKMNYN